MKISYKELLEKYNLLLEENRDLKREIAILTGQSKITENNDGKIVSVNKFSSPQEKIKLYRSLFRGREDVFARRWHSIKSEKSGYQPVTIISQVH